MSDEHRAEPLSGGDRALIWERASHAHLHVPGGPYAPVYPSDVLRVLASEAYWREKAERLGENSE